MNVEKMKELERNSQLCVQIMDMVVNNLRHWNVDAAMRGYRLLIDRFMRMTECGNTYREELAELGLSMPFQAFTEQLSAVMAAQEKRDFILLADMLQMGLRPVLVQWLYSIKEVYQPETTDCLTKNLDALKRKDPWLAEQVGQLIPMVDEVLARFVLEPTESGRNTVLYVDGDKQMYLYGNGDPYVDILNFMKDQVAFGREEYHLLGCASGLQVSAIRFICGDACVVHDYESRLDALYCMLLYSDVADQLLDGTLILHYDPQLQELVRAMSVPNHQVILYPPAIQLIPDEQVRQAIERFYMATHSMEEQKYLLFGNFLQNSKRCSHNIDELESSFAGRKIYIVAAGPSLDKNLHLLAEREADSIVIATGTVYVKMMQMGIRPDYVIVSEANARIQYQFRELWQENIPLLLLSSATWHLARKYAGEKYIIYQEGFEPAEQAAGKEDRKLYSSGGSVSTLALDVAIRLHASIVVFIGLDLAFTGQKAHAEGTSQTMAPDEAALIPAKAYDGGVVYVDTKFQLYANWITRRLNRDNMDDVTNIRVINATEGGAFVKRMEYMTLEEAMQL